MTETPSKWAKNYGRPATAPIEEAEKAPEKPQAARQRTKAAISVPEAPEAAPRPSGSRRGPVKRPVNYRLTDDVLDMVDAAVAAEAAKGGKLTKEEAVATAIRRTYARLLK